MKYIPVIDLFAGPGGLGEGFSAFFPEKRTEHPFKIEASVEMDDYAHRTLELRSFFREFREDNIPKEYYSYIRGEIGRNILFSKYPEQAKRASIKALKATLGDTNDDSLIYQRIEDILTVNGDSPWVLIGGPPCQAYSIIGRARQQAYTVGKEKHQKDKRNFLYREYLEIIAKFRPTVFVMENVAGILSAKIKEENIFNRILTDLRRPVDAVGVKENGWKKPERNLEYKIYPLTIQVDDENNPDPSVYIIKCEEYGIPQARHRVILLGIRSDIPIKPVILDKLNKHINAGDVLSDLPVLRSDFTKTGVDAKGWYEFIQQITEQSWYKKSDNIIIKYGNNRSVNLRSLMRKYISKIRKNLNIGGVFVTGKPRPKYRPDWYVDSNIGGFLNHMSRRHMKEDLYRYFYASSIASITGKSPLLGSFPRELLPNHKNVKVGMGTHMMFDDRFRVQLKNEPARTVTCHISKDGHYSIHFDPKQCRSLTVREAARLQTFPDNYFFEGPRTEQYKQVGNAVPPLLAIQIAGVVHSVIKVYEISRNIVSSEESDRRERNFIYTFS